MPTAVASAVAPQIAQSHVQQDVSPRASQLKMASTTTENPPSSAERKSPAGAARAPPPPPPTLSSPDGKISPNAHRLSGPPKIVVKKEPPSPPDHPASGQRHRPRKLDLTSSTPSKGSAGLPSKPSGPLTASGSMYDMGIACLSPGFQTQDPAMQQQLQRSESVRDQQRHIIEARLQKNAKMTDVDTGRSEPNQSSSLKTPLTSKKRANPGLSIVPPAAEQFANERVIQSAPLNQTFTGRHQPHPLARQIANAQAQHVETSHIHHVPAVQTSNRLPPITDVFANEGIGMPREHQPNGTRPGGYPGNPPTGGHPGYRPAVPSPGLPGPTSAAGPPPSRSREHRSAEEAIAEMTGGREDLRPKIVHYGGHQPPTPPSPSAQQGLTPNQRHHQVPGESSRSGGGRRRLRAEYERDNGSPPLGSGPSPRRAPFGEGRDSPETIRRKKEEFLGLCARAWDLFHN